MPTTTATTGEPPGFADSTLSHVPTCDFSAQLQGCVGADAFLHRGLELVRDNLGAYKATCDQDVLHCTAATRFINIVILDGAYDSSDVAVQTPLQAMFTGGVITRVIGFGPGVDPVQLAKLADWGSGGQHDALLAGDQDQLEQRLHAILGQLDPC